MSSTPSGFPSQFVRDASMLSNFTVPGEPFAWKRVMDGRHGKKVNPKPMRDDQKRVAAIACDKWMGHAPHFGPVKLFVAAIFEIPSSWSKVEHGAAMRGERWRDIDPDADRLLNQVLDALKFVAYVDDNQVVDCRCVQRYGSPARRDVWLERLGGGNRNSFTRRQRKWQGGGYNAEIVKSPAGQARWPLVINADAHRLGFELVR
jgi:Holliday junction resolvase RusA-like endonuclease